VPAGPAGSPPGGRLFSLEERPAPGLYLAAWLLSGLGLGVLLVAGMAEPPVRLLLGLTALGLLTAGLSAAAGYQLVARSSRPVGAYRGPAPLLLFGLWFALVNVGAFALSVAGIEDVDRPGTFLIGLTLQTFAYFLVIWTFVVRGGALGWPQMGLGRQRLAGVAGDVAFSAAIMAPVTLIVLLAGGFIAQLVDADAPSVVPAPTSGPELVAVLIAAVVLVPIGEELFFRGFALTAWLRDLGPRSALVRSAVFFAFVHLANVQSDTFAQGARQAVVLFAVILPLGFVLGWLFLRRGLLAAVTGHMTYNGLVLGLALLRDELVPPTLPPTGP
jgi:membrane protease YdiL (CAAX protease family)